LIETRIVNKPFDLTDAERIESLKAGTLAALSFVLAYSLTVVGNGLVLAAQFEGLATLQITSATNLLVNVAIAWLSGFLFGVTYRYVIRSDQNPHLKSGAVLAFGLVRGLAPVEVEQNLTEAFWSLSILGIESILCFAIARFTLDWTFHRHWIKPFK
jgi:cellobiose-specific phosphotransferase system component IIC